MEKLIQVLKHNWAHSSGARGLLAYKITGILKFGFYYLLMKLSFILIISCSSLIMARAVPAT